ncbi:hypothetical protein RND71_039539 [Anisodus tanguticus]|uniref:Uncharacterized protein n=1 Tax=Anisodus tanguticus TaxID=243964 RepID=A0AAE1QWU4_9SOLA|nr:hypothetical protein RND71_039539 [Anisodus tanguticus]
MTDDDTTATEMVSMGSDGPKQKHKLQGSSRLAVLISFKISTRTPTSFKNSNFGVFFKKLDTNKRSEVGERDDE